MERDCTDPDPFSAKKCSAVEVLAVEDWLEEATTGLIDCENLPQAEKLSSAFWTAQCELYSYESHRSRRWRRRRRLPLPLPLPLRYYYYYSYYYYSSCSYYYCCCYYYCCYYYYCCCYYYYY